MWVNLLLRSYQGKASQILTTRLRNNISQVKNVIRMTIPVQATETYLTEVLFKFKHFFKLVFRPLALPT